MTDKKSGSGAFLAFCAGAAAGAAYVFFTSKRTGTENRELVSRYVDETSQKATRVISEQKARVSEAFPEAMRAVSSAARDALESARKSATGSNGASTRSDGGESDWEASDYGTTPYPAPSTRRS